MARFDIDAALANAGTDGPQKFKMPSAPAVPQESIENNSGRQPAGIASLIPSSLNRGAAGLIDSVANTPTNLLNLGKAAVGSALYATGSPMIQDAADKYGFTTMTEPPSPASRLLEATGTGQVRPVTPLEKRIDWAAQAVPATMLSPTQGVSNIAKLAGMNALSGLAGGETYERTGNGNAAILASILAPMAVGSAGAVMAARKEAKAIRQEPIRKAAAEAQQAGYVIPPSTTNPSLTNTLLEGYSGKIKTAQLASQKNQNVTNAKVARDLGLDTAQLTNENLAAIRKQAGQAYENVKGTGQVVSDTQYITDLDALANQYQGAGKAFPGLARNDVSELVDSLKTPTFGADSAVDAIRILREKADSAYASGDKALGKTAKGAADAMEGLLERHLAQTGDQGMLRDFQTARQTIAKTYTAQNALNPATGNISAQKLAIAQRKGKPISGEMRDVASFGNAFTKAAQEVRDSVPALSPLDFFGAGSIAAGTSNPAVLSHLLARPAVRELILSPWYQKAMAIPAAPTGRPTPLTPTGSADYAASLADSLKAFPDIEKRALIIHNLQMQDRKRK